MLIDLLTENPDIQLVFPKTDDELFQEIIDTDILVGVDIPPHLDLEHTSVKLFQSLFASVDQLDLSRLQEQGVSVCNTHGRASTVAEHTLALILATLRFIPKYDSRLRKGQWMFPEVEIDYPFSLRDKTVTFFGFGHVGTQLYDLLTPFNIRPVIVKRNPEVGAEHFDLVVSDSDLSWAASEADVLVVIVPLTKRTRERINLDVIENMRDTAILVNVSQGRVIVESDLYYALTHRLIAGAGLDVWWNYPYHPLDKLQLFPFQYPFQELPNVVMTPHIAWVQKEFNPLVIQEITDNILAFHHNKPLQNLVSYEEEY